MCSGSARQVAPAAPDFTPDLLQLHASLGDRGSVRLLTQHVGQVLPLKHPQTVEPNLPHLRARLGASFGINLRAAQHVGQAVPQTLTLP